MARTDGEQKDEKEPEAPKAPTKKAKAAPADVDPEHVKMTKYGEKEPIFAHPTQVATWAKHGWVVDQAYEEAKKKEE